MSIEQILELKRQGLSLRKIAEQVGLSKSRVHQLVQASSEQSSNRLGKAKTASNERVSTKQSTRQVDEPAAPELTPEERLLLELAGDIPGIEIPGAGEGIRTIPAPSVAVLDDKTKQSLNELARMRLDLAKQEVGLKQARIDSDLDYLSRVKDLRLQLAERQMAQPQSRDGKGDDQSLAFIGELTDRISQLEGEKQSQDIKYREEMHDIKMKQLEAKIDGISKAATGRSPVDAVVEGKSEIKEIGIIVSEKIDKAVDRIAGVFERRGLPQMPNLPGVALPAAQLVSELEAVQKAAQSQELTATEKAALASFLQRQHGIKPASTDNIKEAICPSCQTKNLVDVAELKVRAATSPKETVFWGTCHRCSKRFDITYLVSSPSPTLTVSPPAQPGQGLGQKVGPGVYERQPELRYE